MKKVKVKIEFSQKVKYYVETKLSEDDFLKIEELDNDDVGMYLRDANGKIVINETYDIISNYIDSDYICDADDEITDVTVTKLD